MVSQQVAASTSVLKRKTWLLVLVAVALTLSDAMYSFATAPVSSSYPIYLEPAGSPHHEESKRQVCAAWLSIERTAPSSSMEWWIAISKDSSLYAEIRSAKGLEFEIDIGSGLSDVCVSEELDFRARPDIVKAVLDGCGGAVPPRGPAGQLMAIHLREAAHSVFASGCEVPAGTPRLSETPP
jgi:hypothetical protein